MSVTATDLKANLGKYLVLAATEDVYITRNTKDFAGSPVRIFTPSEFIEVLEHE